MDGLWPSILFLRPKFTEQRDRGDWGEETGLHQVHPWQDMDTENRLVFYSIEQIFHKH